MEETVESNDYLVTAHQRLNAAASVLLRIKTLQERDTAPDLPQEEKDEFGCRISLLYEAGLIRKTNASDGVPEGMLPYRITWKGLAFIDTFLWLDRSLKIHAPNSIQNDLAWLAALSFH